jgi:hypothetical protein
MKTEKADYPTRDKSLIGAAGVHFVASQLSLRGLIGQLKSARPGSAMTIPLIAVLAIAAGQAHAGQRPAAALCRDIYGPYSQLGSPVMMEPSGVIELRVGNGRWRIEMAKLPIHAVDCESSGDKEMCKAAKEDPCVKCIRNARLVAWDESRR